LFQKLLRIYSYLFAAAASIAYLALGLVSKTSGTQLTLDNMPWKSDELSNWLLGLAALGFISVLAAVTGSRLRILLTIFCAILMYVTVKGNFLSTHSFAGADDFERTIGLSFGSILAFLASLLQLKTSRPAAAVALPPPSK
jgi:hypothetical protein